MQRRISKMYNQSKLIVTVKSLIGAKVVHSSLMLQPLISVNRTFYAVSILNVYETALTYMMNTNDVHSTH